MNVKLPTRWIVMFAVFFVALGGIFALRLRKSGGAPSEDVTDFTVRLSKQLLPSGTVKELNYAMGMKLAKKKDYAGAKKVFEDLLAQEPTNPSILNNLAFVAAESGEAGKAAEYLTSATKVSDRCAECFNNLGSLLYKEGKHEEAKRMFEKAVQLDPKYVDPRLNLAVLYEEESDWNSAMEWYHNAEVGIEDPEVKKWVATRANWMQEISTNTRRSVAGSSK